MLRVLTSKASVTTALTQNEPFVIHYPKTEVNLCRVHCMLQTLEDIFSRIMCMEDIEWHMDAEFCDDRSLSDFYLRYFKY